MFGGASTMIFRVKLAKGVIEQCHAVTLNVDCD